MQSHIAIGVIGDFDETFTPHAATGPAVEHAAAPLGLAVDVQWLATDVLEADPAQVEAFDALWAAPGSPYKNMNAALEAIRFAREEGVPLLGSCGGCQHVVVEYARNVLGIQDAQHAEYDPYASVLFVSELSCSLVGRTMHVTIEPGSRAATFYEATEAREQYYCNFGLNPQYQRQLHDGGLLVTGVDADGEARVVEIPDHPFFIATLFVPATSSSPGHPHPLISAFLQTAAERAPGAALTRTA